MICTPSILGMLLSGPAVLLGILIGGAMSLAGLWLYFSLIGAARDDEDDGAAATLQPRKGWGREDAP